MKEKGHIIHSYPLLRPGRREAGRPPSLGDRHCQGAPSVSTATHPPKGSHLQSSDRHSRAAARKANEVLREMGRLKTEMKALLTSQFLQNQSQSKTSPNKPPPVPTTSPNNQSQQYHHQSQQIHSSTVLKVPTNQSQSRNIQSPRSPFQQIQPQQSQTQFQSSSSPIVLVQRRPVVPSMFEEAG
ncbi:protein TALPID3-like isoform X2 [Lates japonicus]|uniref:Protein TALPID3-like isoform X2 n=1 Tax=Lates japonicus TaxID=270547 RepID=A0AAD3RHI2_LATJO|nr:protein TALPID3-like isoform X2 [Lates japonicus]